MNSIEYLNKLNEDIQTLQKNYNKALNCIYNFRIIKSALINAINNNDTETLKEYILPKVNNVEEYRKDLINVNLVEDSIKSYSSIW